MSDALFQIEHTSLVAVIWKNGKLKGKVIAAFETEYEARRYCQAMPNAIQTGIIKMGNYELVGDLI